MWQLIVNDAEGRFIGYRVEYLPDTNEVILLKTVEGNEEEAIYSELLDDA